MAVVGAKREVEKIKRRIDLLVEAVLKDVEDKNLRIDLVARLIEMKELLNGKKPSSGREG